MKIKLSPSQLTSSKQQQINADIVDSNKHTKKLTIITC